MLDHSHRLLYLVMQGNGFVLFFNVFKMDTETGIAALPRTMTSRSLRSPSGSLWPSLTTILCPCPPTRMQLMRSCPSKRGRSSGWEFTIRIKTIKPPSVHLFIFKVNPNYKLLVVCCVSAIDKHYNPKISGVINGYFRKSAESVRYSS